MNKTHCLFILFSAILLILFYQNPSHALDKDLEKAKALNRKVVRLYKQGRYAKAIPLAKRALAIREKTLGPDHPHVATSLYNLAELYRLTKEYAKAVPLFKRVNAIREKVLGPRDPKLAKSLNQLAVLYTSTRDYAKAEPLYKRALAIWEKALGPEHRFVATGLGNLASLYFEQGDYAKAEPLYERAIRLDEKILGLEHPRLATILTNLAVLYKYQGKYARAEPLYKRALAIQEKSLRPDHPALASTLNNLGEFYRLLGYYDKAKPLFERALAIREKVLGPEHPDLAVTLDNLASLYFNRKNYEKSAALYQRGLAIWKAVLGPEHAEVATNLNNMAGVYYSLGDRDKAEAYYKEAISISQKALGPKHPRVAMGLNNLAEVYYASGNYGRAEPLFSNALAIREEGLGSEHPLVASNLDDLATVYAATGRIDQANNLYLRSQKITNKVVNQVMAFTSETEKMQFINTKIWSLYRAMNLIYQHLSHDRVAIKDAMNMWLRRKGIILEAQKRFQEALVYSDDHAAVKTFQELSRVRARLSRLAFSGPGKEGVKTYKKKLADLEKQKDVLEAKMSKISQAFALKQKIAKADCRKVAKALPANTVLIEFIRIKIFNFKAKGKEKKWRPAHYLSFVLHAGKGDTVGMVDLGDAETLDKAVARFKKEIADVKDLKGTKAVESSRKIYALVFEPLRRELGDVKEIFISPDGNLNLIPFEVLQGPDGKYLIEDYTFNYLGAGRDVLGFGQIREQGENVLLMGDPDFDIVVEEKNSSLKRLGLSNVGHEEIGKRSSDMRGFHFSRLPGTKREVEAIQMLIGEDIAELYTGKEALEEVLRQRDTPRILHLATHGFFLSDLDYSDLSDEALDRGIHAKPKPQKSKAKKIKIKNPLLRSGIALAGANNALKEGDTGKSDGIVTAEKILGLRLRGTDMVILSACETGLGEVKTGEGVFGLGRAFTQAGTRSLVMSMWSVPDRETKELMVEFYRNILSGKINRAQALRQAALKEMKIVKDRYGHTNPFFWGAFVYLGEP